jgi:hypothetical protein
MVQLLLDHHADPEQLLGNFDRPLHLYAERGDIEVLKIVLLHGVEVDSNPGGFYSPAYKPLHYAARCSVDAVKLLLKHGVDICEEEGPLPGYAVVRCGSRGEDRCDEAADGTLA